MCATFFPLELRFHACFEFLLISTKCHNSLENHGRNEHHIVFIFASMKFFLMAMENVVFTLCFTVIYVFHMTLLHPPTPPTPPSVNNNETFNVTPSSNQATSSRIQHHPTHFTWCYYTHTHPHPPPHPPSLYKNDLYGIASRLRVPRSSGEPPALSLYIYTHTCSCCIILDLSIYLSIYLSVCPSICLSINLIYLSNLLIY